MSPIDNIERRLEQFRVTTEAETDKRILDDAFAALQKGLQKQRPGIWPLVVNRRLAGPVAAAAVILIALGLLLGRPDSKADTVEDFYRTLGGARNICVSMFEAGQTDPHQQVWASDSLKVRLFQTGIGGRAHFDLWDIGRNIHMAMYLSTVKTELLTAEKLTELESSAALSAGLAPFSHAADVPESARWGRASDSALQASISGCKVYDLVWVQQDVPPAGAIHRRWRVFLDDKTHLPKRAELYARSEPGEEYSLMSYVKVTYPSETEIQDVVTSIFGPPGSRTGGPEYAPTPGMER